MDYVVLDLEWNQASDSRDARNRLLTFEIIEILPSTGSCYSVLCRAT